MRRARLAALAALSLGLAGAAGPAPQDGGGARPIGQAPERAPVRALEGTPYLSSTDLARLLDATKYWSPEVRKLVLRARDHRIRLTADNPFVVIDNRTVLLPAPVRSVGGELHVPIALVDSLPYDETLPRLYHDPRGAHVFQVPPGGLVRSPRVSEEGAVTRVVFPAERAEDVAVASRSRAHFRLRFDGYFAGVLPADLPRGLVRGLRTIPSADGSAFEIAVSREAAGYRLEQDAEKGLVVLTLERAERPELESFAPEGPPGPRPLGVVVLDPGHGGDDAGVTAGGHAEKQLTLELARLLKRELEQRLKARVILTREDDREMGAGARAERANHVRADVVLSLHFDGFGSPQTRGATGYCPPATYAGAAPVPGPVGTITLLPWRDVGVRHAVRSRELADALLSALELRAFGPTRLREVLPVPLLGVNAPGVLLECGTLTSEADRRRVATPEGLAALAATLADGFEAYARAE